MLDVKEGVVQRLGARVEVVEGAAAGRLEVLGQAGHFLRSALVLALDT